MTNVADYLGDLAVKLDHLSAKHIAELAHHFLVPCIILQPDLRLNLQQAKHILSADKQRNTSRSIYKLTQRMLWIKDDAMDQRGYYGS